MRPATPAEPDPRERRGEDLGTFGPGGARGGGGQSPRTALVVGATGLVGRHLVRILTGDDAYASIRVVARRPLPEELTAPKIEQRVFPFEELRARRTALAADHVFCALGTTRSQAGSKAAFREVDLVYPLRIAEATRHNGARHFSLVSAVGASPSSWFFYNRVKGEVEEAIRQVGWPSGAVLRPSVLGGEHEGRPLERLGQMVARWVPGRYRLVEAEDVARVMVRLAKAEAPGWKVVESEAIRTLAQ